MDVWLRRELPSPPLYTIKYTAQERRTDNFDICVQALLEGVLCGHAVLCDEEVSGCFRREAAILAASLFQNGRLRTEKFYRILKKVKKFTDRWIELDLSKILDNLRHLMPAIPPAHRPVRMPSKQMFEYLLIRILGGFHLLLGLDGHCRDAASYIMSKISSGHFFCTSMAFLANVARLRALALDLCGQLSKLYDDIFPWVQRLKGSSTPSLVLLESLPPTLSDYLQQYCTSLKVNSTPTVVKDASKDMHFSSMLKILLEDEEEGNSRINSQPGGSSGYKEGLEGAAASGVSPKQTEIFLSEEHQLDDSRPPSSAVCSEDIGVCVKRKFSGHLSTVNNGNKRLKNSLKRGMENVSESPERTKTASVTVRKNTAKVKRKRDLEESESSKKKKTIVNHQCKSDVNVESNITPKFVKHYRRVKKTVKEINSMEDLSSFLRLEKRRRCEKDCERVSSLLKKDDWNLFRKLIITRVKNAKKLRIKDPTSHQNIQMEQVLTKTKTRLKFWLLYPHLKGKKPKNWKSILLAIKNRKRKKAIAQDEK